MDVYQKVLTRLLEITGGKDSVDVDLTDLLKKEGFFPSIDSIRDYMSSESWITETSRRNVVRITHWGVAAAKKVNTSGAATNAALTRELNKFVAAVKELAVMAEEFSSNPDTDKLNRIEARLGEVSAGCQKIRANM